MKQQSILKRIYFIEGVTFSLIIFMIWVDEYFVLPWGTERFFETLLVMLLAIAICRFHFILQKRLKTAEKLLPICAHCKCIRNDKGYWKQVEDYISEHSDTEFTHTLCPECASLLYPEEFPSSPLKPSGLLTSSQWLREER